MKHPSLVNIKRGHLSFIIVAVVRLVLILTVAFTAGIAYSQDQPSDDTLWKQLDTAGSSAHAQGRYVEAEKLWLDGLKVAERFGTQDGRLAISLNNLAELYRSQGKYAEAEPLYKRVLAIREKVLGPNHPDLAQSLESYAALLRQTDRPREATALEARAKVIRARNLQGRPIK